jgi:hypothetical protein
MNRLLPAITIFALAAGSAQPATAAAIQIAYLATDVADTGPGEDLWEYQYFVTGFDFAADQGFGIAFDAALYAGLEDPPPAVNADWDPIVFQPDPGLASAGIYDALALVTGASLADPFVLTFAWLGGPGQTPGPQPFTLNAFDAGGLLTVLETGTTVPYAAPVPEPSTLVLVTIGAAGAAWRARAARRTARGRR